MKIIYTVLLIILAASFFLLTADTGYYQLQKESIEYSGVINWLSSEPPTPVFDRRIGGVEFIEKPAKFIYSPGQHYFGTVQHRQARISVEWYTANGNQLGSYQENWQDDMPLPDYSIIDSGNRLLSVDIRSRVRMIGPAGEIESKFTLLPEIPFNTENALFYRYLEQKQWLAAGFRQIMAGDETQDRAISIFVVADLKGKEILRREYPEWQIDAVNASTQGQYFCLALHKFDPGNNDFSFRTLLLNSEGELLADLPYQHHTAEFSPDDNFLVFYENNIAYLYNIRQTKIVQIYPSAENHIFMKTVFLSENNDFVLQSGVVFKDYAGWAYKDVKISTCNIMGNELDHIELTDHKICQPALWYDASLGQLFIGFSDGWHIYKTKK